MAYDSNKMITFFHCFQRQMAATILNIKMKLGEKNWANNRRQRHITGETQFREGDYLDFKANMTIFIDIS